jgi:hypothetical protein
MLSFEQRREAIRAALKAKFTSLSDDYWWIVATFDDYVIVEKGDEHFRVSYTVDDNHDITIGDETKVEIAYTPVSECQGRSKSRPRWRRKTRPPSRWGGVARGRFNMPERMQDAGLSCCGRDDSSRRSATKMWT